MGLRTLLPLLMNMVVGVLWAVTTVEVMVLQLITWTTNVNSSLVDTTVLFSTPPRTATLHASLGKYFTSQVSVVVPLVLCQPVKHSTMISAQQPLAKLKENSYLQFSTLP